MTNDWDPTTETRSKRWIWWLLLIVATFAGGVAISLYAVQRSPWLRSRLDLVPPSAQATTQRLQRVERILAQVAARASETSDSADRAEGLLVAFAARRALDRGATLGYIEGLLRERFGGSQPQAVATILAASHQPVTLEELQTGLDRAASMLVSADPRENWWQGVRRELAGLVVLRRAAAPSTAPVDRLERARRQLQAGHVDLALAEVARMPGRDRASEWIIQARRYASARRALDMIETAALLAPHGEFDADASASPLDDQPAPSPIDKPASRTLQL